MVTLSYGGFVVTVPGCSGASRELVGCGVQTGACGRCEACAFGGFQGLVAAFASAVGGGVSGGIGVGGDVGAFGVLADGVVGGGVNERRQRADVVAAGLVSRCECGSMRFEAKHVGGQASEGAHGGNDTSGPQSVSSVAGSGEAVGRGSGFRDELGSVGAGATREAPPACGGGVGSGAVGAGVNRERNRRWRSERKAKKQRRQARAAAAAPVWRKVETVVSDSGIGSDDSLARSLAERRRLENELAAERVALRLQVERDPAVRQMRVEVARHRIVGQVGDAMVKSQNSIDKAASISPESSISQREAREMQRQLDEALYRCYVLEKLARSTASREEFLEADRSAPAPKFEVPPMEADVTMEDRVRAVKMAFPDLHPEYAGVTKGGVDF